MHAEVLDVQQRERHARTTQLEMECRAVRLGTHARGCRLRVELRFELCVGQSLDGVSVEAERADGGDDARYRARADARRSRDLAVAPSERELLSQDLSYVLHGKSLCRHTA